MSFHFPPWTPPKCSECEIRTTVPGTVYCKQCAPERTEPTIVAVGQDRVRHAGCSGREEHAGCAEFGECKTVYTGGIEWTI